jgi:hypothetical protein
MNLSEIKRYLSQRKTAPLQDIALHFDMNPEAVRGMLEQWIRKGKVRRMGSGGCDSGCCGGCEQAVNEVYEWLQEV